MGFIQKIRDKIRGKKSLIQDAPTKKPKLVSRMRMATKSKYHCSAIIYMNDKPLTRITLSHHANSGNIAIKELNKGITIKITEAHKVK